MLIQIRKSFLFLLVSFIFILGLWNAQTIQDATRKIDSSISLDFNYFKQEPKHVKSPLVHIYDVHMDIYKAFDCLWLKTNPPAPVCLYNIEDDNIISRSIKEYGIYEGGLISLFQHFLAKDPKLGVLDIGANIGIYSLVAVAMGHNVVAVEPVIDNLQRFHQAIKIGGYESQITVIKNAVTDRRGNFTLRLNPKNQGNHILQWQSQDDLCQRAYHCQNVDTIIMDDLMYYLPFTKAIMKIDIEQQEHRAFRYSEKLLEHLYIPYIFMEWMHLGSYYQNADHSSEDKSLVEDMIDMLTEMGYKAYGMGRLGERTSLEVSTWHEWPWDVIWIRHKTSGI